MTIGIKEINVLFKIDSLINRIVVSEKMIKKKVNGLLKRFKQRISVNTK